MVERNYPLYIGLILSLLFGLVALCGPALAPHDPLQAYDQVITIGGGFTYAVEKDNLEAWTIMTSGYPELGQMLSNVWAKIIKVPWEPLIVGIVVFAMIFAFNLLGEGLRRKMDYTRARGPKQRGNN